MVERKIVWQKWIDPIASQTEDVEFDSIEGDEYKPYMDSYEKLEKSQKNIGPVLMGPMGVIPLNENSSPSKIFKFWIGHTNFNLSLPILKQIESVSGVETLDVFTRYRFRISVGRLFKTRNVCSEITQLVCGNKVVDDPKLPINLIKKQMSKYTHWAIFALPNGKLDSVGSNDEYIVQQAIKDKEKEGIKVVARSYE
jgi:hypothetical protein